VAAAAVVELEGGTFFIFFFFSAYWGNKRCAKGDDGVKNGIGSGFSSCLSPIHSFSLDSEHFDQAAWERRSWEEEEEEEEEEGRLLLSNKVLHLLNRKDANATRFCFRLSG